MKQLSKSLDHERGPCECRRMNVARRTSLPLDAFLIELCCFSVLEIVGDVRVAIVRARIDVQNLFRRRGAGKICEQLVSTREPGAHWQFAADVCKRILERVSIPKTDAVAILQTIERFRCERLHIGSQQLQVAFIKTRRQNAQLCIAETEVFRLDQIRDFGDPRRLVLIRSQTFEKRQKLERGTVGGNVCRVDSQFEIAGDRFFQHHTRNRWTIGRHVHERRARYLPDRNSQSDTKRLTSRAMVRISVSRSPHSR